MKYLLFLSLISTALACNNGSETTPTDRDRTTVNDTSSVSPSVPRRDTIKPLPNTNSSDSLNQHK